ncbi:hypothetical protein O988_09360 [Pseudogymnoascus sp. VKM F-3808]|nr:hypothetical protein O988_09360 [Pseudogymnoascus sp. VKM F-3808]
MGASESLKSEGLLTRSSYITRALTVSLPTVAPTTEQAVAAPSETTRIAEQPSHVNTNSPLESAPDSKLIVDENIMSDNTGEPMTKAQFLENMSTFYRMLEFSRSRQGLAMINEELTRVKDQMAESKNRNLNLRQISPEEIDALLQAQKRINPDFNDDLFRELHGLAPSVLDRTTRTSSSKTSFSGAGCSWARHLLCATATTPKSLAKCATLRQSTMPEDCQAYQHRRTGLLDIL